MRMPSQKSLHYIELFIAALIFISGNNFSFQFAYMLDSVFWINLLLTVLFLALMLEFVLFREPKGGREKLAVSVSRHAIFVAMLLLYFALLASVPPLLVSLLKMFWLIGVFFVAFIPLFFLVFIAVFLIRTGHKKAVIMLVAALLILVLYYPSKVLIYTFKASDEELIMFQSVASLLNGVNPYTVSYSDLVYQNAKTIGFTLTTTQNLMGTLAYPALFFLSFVPFYFVSAPTIQNLMAIDLPLEAAVFSFLLMVALAFVLEKKELINPRLSLIVLFVFAITNTASVTVYLMTALLLLAYSLLDSKYSWLLLGLCLSIQEELWLPVLFLIAYSMNNKGIRGGLRDLAGAAAVFVAINAYFIIAAPGAYFGNVFDPLNSLIFPNGYSGIGISIVKLFPILLSTFSLLFELVALLLAFLLLYWNKKELIPLFSMIPFLVLDHSLNSYYATFIFVFIFAIGTGNHKEKAGLVQRALGKRKTVPYLVFAAMSLLILAVVISSHSSAVSAFNISTSEPSLVFDTSNMSSVYRTIITYSNLANSTIYVVAVGADGNANIGFLGLLNSSIISNPIKCNVSDCLVNINRITLPGSSGSYDLTVRLKWSNSTIPIRYAAVELYNGKHFYFGRSAYNASKVS
jgi:hypothetical protein